LRALAKIVVYGFTGLTDLGLQASIKIAKQRSVGLNQGKGFEITATAKWALIVDDVPDAFRYPLLATFLHVMPFKMSNQACRRIGPDPLKRLCKHAF
jgi:hypothetical protein